MGDEEGSGPVRRDGGALVVEGPLALRGVLRPAGDKSISHRALLLAALADGESRISNLGVGEDVGSTLRLLQVLGVAIEGPQDGEVRVRGSGLEGLNEPHRVIDCGNSATTMRLGSGLVAGLPYLTVLTGDPSLRRRPMERVALPLQKMGAAVATAPGGVPPLMVRGGGLRAVDYELPVPSAQVKGAILLAGLQARGRTVVRERFFSREHTETMLQALGAAVEIRDGEIAVSPSRPDHFDARLPGDISSAAFFLIGACMLEGSEVRAEGVVLSPARRRFAEVMQSMGGEVFWAIEGDSLGQPYGSVSARCSGLLDAVEITAPAVPALIDELVMIATSACLARGTTRITGAAELRRKESDRIGDLAVELRKTGASVEELDDGMVIEGLGGPPPPAEYNSHGDHRIAMAAAILACAGEGRSRVEGIEVAAVSNPRFVEDLVELTNSGGDVATADPPAGG